MDKKVQDLFDQKQNGKSKKKCHFNANHSIRFLISVNNI